MACIGLGGGFARVASLRATVTLHVPPGKGKGTTPGRSSLRCHIPTGFTRGPDVGGGWPGLGLWSQEKTLSDTGPLPVRGRRQGTAGPGAYTYRLHSRATPAAAPHARSAAAMFSVPVRLRAHASLVSKSYAGSGLGKWEVTVSAPPTDGGRCCG